MTTLHHCVECAEDTPNLSLICERCEPLYRPAPMIDDECPCLACRSDLAGLAECMKGDGK